MGDFKLLIPIGGAIIGSYFGVGAVGWMVGSWVMNTQFADDNDIVDPGAEEMPRFNQALRGSTMPVLFGTNRVSTQLIWTANYTATREQSDSGGKAGGSGGGKTPPQSGQAAYTYSWDLLYHMGMSDEQMGIFSIWLGADRVDQDITAGISSNAPVTLLLGFIAQAKSDGPTLLFDEAYYYGGGQIADSWTHLDSELGHTVRFPWTIWLGFKQLSLGAYPHVPQLSFEVGPNEGGLTEGPTNATYWTDTSAFGSQPRTAPNGDSTRLDTFGQLYQLNAGVAGSNEELEIIGADGSIVNSNVINTYYTEIGTFLGDDWGTYSAHGAVTTLLQGQYVAIVVIAKSPAHSSQEWETLAIYQPVEGDRPVLICAYRMLIGFSIARGSDDAIFLAHQGGVADSIVTFTSQVSATGGGGFNFRVFPPIFDYINLTYSGGGPGVAAPRTYEVPHRRLNGTGARMAAALLDTDTTTIPNNKKAGFWVTPGGANTIVNFYLSKEGQIWHAANPTHADRWPYNTEVIEPANPNGAMIQMDLGLIQYGTYVGGDISESDVTVVNSKYVDQDGNTIAPFDDDYQDRLGVSRPNEYRNNVIFKWLDENKTLAILIIHKLFNDTTSQTTTPHSLTNYGSYIKIRAFIYDILTDKFTQFVNTDPILMWDEDGAEAKGKPESSFPWVNQWSTHLNMDADFNLTYEGIQGPGAAGMSPLDTLSAGLGVINPGSASDLTPAEIIRRLLQDNIYGRGLSNAIVDQTSFAVAHQYCLDNNFLVSTQYRREQKSLSQITALLSLYDGFLRITGGQIKFGIRELTVTPVRTLDNDHFVHREGEAPVEIIPGARQDSFNKIKVNFINRSLDYHQDYVEISDEVDIDINGVRAREFPSQFVMTKAMASVIAERTLWSNLYGRSAYSFPLGPKDSDLEPGDVVNLVDSFTNLNVNARIIQWVEREKFEYEVAAIQELSYINASSRAPADVGSPSTQNIFQSPGYPLEQVIYELPAEFQLDSTPKIYASYVSDGKPIGATMYVSADGLTYSPAITEQPYPLAGTILSGLPNTPPGSFVEDVQVAVFPSSGSELTASSFIRNETLAEVSPATRSVGGSLILVGSEMIAYEGVTLVSQNVYRFSRVYRGWGGTHIHVHSAGDRWFKHGSGVFFRDFNENQIGTTFSAKIVPFDGLGNLSNISSIDARTYTIQGMHVRPQVAQRPRTIVDSFDYRGQSKIAVNSTIDIHQDWRDSARESGFGVGGFGVGVFGRFTPDVLSHSWRVEVVGSGDVVVRSEVVNSTTYNYTSSKNFEDNGAWRGTLGFKVTPFGEHGDAPRTSVNSVEIW